MAIWFTSDTHYYHKNVIKYCKRPFASLEDMHDGLIANWHAKVKDGDTVYILGDFAFCGTQKGKELVDRLRGDKKLTIYLIRGNHDATETRCHKMGFDDVADSATLFYHRHTFELSHYPYKPTAWETLRHKAANFFKFWRRLKYKELRYMDKRPKDEGGWLLHGHVHNSWKQRGRQINVGVDVWDYSPVSLDELIKITT